MDDPDEHPAAIEETTEEETAEVYLLSRLTQGFIKTVMATLVLIALAVGVLAVLVLPKW